MWKVKAQQFLAPHLAEIKCGMCGSQLLCFVKSEAGVYKSQVTKFCVVVPNTFGFTVWNMIHITYLVPRILRWRLHFIKFVHSWMVVAGKGKHL
jgi:hypothetical protein